MSLLRFARSSARLSLRPCQNPRLVRLPPSVVKSPTMLSTALSMAVVATMLVMAAMAAMVAVGVVAAALVVVPVTGTVRARAVVVVAAVGDRVRRGRRRDRAEAAFGLDRGGQQQADQGGEWGVLEHGNLRGVVRYRVASFANPREPVLNAGAAGVQGRFRPGHWLFMLQCAKMHPRSPAGPTDDQDPYMSKTSFPRADIRILLLEGISQSAVEVFREAGYTQIEHHAKSLPEDELAAAVARSHVVGIRSRSQLTAEMFDDARRLLAVGCFCIGTNQVALDAAEAAGVPVFNAPYSNTRSVAELVIAQTVMLMRRIPERNAACHRGGWLKTADGSYEVRGKTLGIVGYGHIGTQVGVLAEALGMEVLFHDVETKLAMGTARPADSLEDLLARIEAYDVEDAKEDA